MHICTYIYISNQFWTQISSCWCISHHISLSNQLFSLLGRFCLPNIRRFRFFLWSISQDMCIIWLVLSAIVNWLTHQFVDKAWQDHPSVSDKNHPWKKPRGRSHWKGEGLSPPAIVSFHQSPRHSQPAQVAMREHVREVMKRRAVKLPSSVRGCSIAMFDRGISRDRGGRWMEMDGVNQIPSGYLT